MKTAKAVALVLYGLQLFVVLPWCFGALYRREQSLWVWQEYKRHAERFGTSDAILSVYLYLLFY